MLIHYIKDEDKWDQEEDLEIIKCPICNKRWYSDGEYTKCKHLKLVLCTYDYPYFAYVAGKMKSNHLYISLRSVVDYNNQNIDDEDYIPPSTIEDQIVKIIQSIDNTEDLRILIDEHIPSPPEISYFITIFCYTT